MAGHSLERAYYLLPAFSTLDLCQMACRLLLYPLPDEAVILILDVAEKVEAFTDWTNSIIRLYPQSQLRNLADIKVAQLPKGLLTVRKNYHIITIAVIQIPYLFSLLAM